MVHRRDRSQVAKLVHEHSPALLRTAYLLTGDLEEAERLLRTAVIRTNLTGSPEPGPTEVRRLIVSMVESPRWTLTPWRSGPGIEEVEPVEPSGPGGERAERHRLWQQFEQLPAELQIVVVGRYHDELNDEEIAEIAGVGIDEVHGRIGAALAALQSELPDLADSWHPDGPAEAPHEHLDRLLRGTLAEHAAEADPPPGWATRTVRLATAARVGRVAAPVAAAAMILAVFALAGGSADRDEPSPAARGPAVTRSAPPSPKSVPAPAAGGVAEVVNRLAAGEPPRVPYAVDESIVLGPGRTVDLPGPYRNLGVLLFGTDEGLYVPVGIADDGDDRDDMLLHITADGRITELPESLGQRGFPFTSADGRYALWTARAGFDEPAYAKLADLRTGDIIASQRLPDALGTATSAFPMPLISDFDGTTALIVGHRREGEATYARWVPAEGRLEPVRHPPDFFAIWTGSLASDTLLATVDGESGRCLVNVATSRPDRERWRLCTDGPVPFISPDGRRVALRRVDDPVATTISLEVRELTTGDVVSLRRIELREPVSWAALWESPDSILVVLRDWEESELRWVRCPVADDASCERVPAGEGDQLTAVAITRVY